MSAKNIRYVSNVIKAGLLVLPVISLIVPGSLFFPFITGKNFFFRALVEILFFLWVLIAVFDKQYRPKKTPLFYALGATLFILVLATIFGENPYRSFWSNYERMEGLVAHFHLFAYFLILTSVFKSKKDWKIFFASNLVVSFILSIYGFFQLAGKTEIHQGGVRLDATLGNATYLAILMVFNFFIAALFFRWFKNVWVRVLLSILMASQLVIVFFTATRGAILGLLGGLILLGILLVLSSKDKKIRYLAFSILVLAVVAVSAFMFARNTSFVQNNQTLSRFANLSFSDTTTVSRLTIWKMSLRGFSEHPVLGWGPENFNIVFNKYFEPKLWRQEPWFDRAHNVFFDWLISAGSLGFLAYLSIFISAIFMLWKSMKRGELSSFETSAIIALFAAYGFHNLFVFDNLTSYFMFFSVLGFVNYSYSFSKNKEENPNDSVKKQELKTISGGSEGLKLTAISFAFLAVLLSLYFVTLKPFLACRSLLGALQTASSSQDPAETLEVFEKVFSYKTFGTGEGREQLVAYTNAVFESSAFSDQQKSDLSKKTISEIEKQIVDNPKDLRSTVMLSSLYLRAGRIDDALKMANKALELSPKKQQLYFAKADVYLTLGQNDKALEILKSAYDLAHGNPDSIRNLAIVYLLDGQHEETEKLLLNEYKTLAIADKSLLNAFAKTGHFDRVRDIWLEFIRQEPTNAQYHISLAATYLQLGDRVKTIEELQKAIELNPEFKEQGEYFINEIKEGRNP
ncbi:MAG: O-antigen ligase family protein [Candidatus Pacebacteria bacterium]|nr:O-antigen ligase family protein [Candidatus Paceibacterota bacterium]